jgi:hypothetical protein
MPYLCALIEAAEKEAVLSHPHAGKGAEMGEGFAGLTGALVNLTPYGIAFFVSEEWLSGAPCAPPHQKKPHERKYRLFGVPLFLF